MTGSSVYFAQGVTGGPIKIGTSISLAKRIKALSSGSPLPLVLLASAPGDARHELSLHRRFADHRLHGEWFRPHPDLLACIARIVEAGNLAIEITEEDEAPMLVALRRAIAAAGSQSALAGQIGTTQQNVAFWVRRGRVKAEWVLKVERATGISQHDLRPDIYPPGRTFKLSA